MLENKAFEEKNNFEIVFLDSEDIECYSTKLLKNIEIDKKYKKARKLFQDLPYINSYGTFLTDFININFSTNTEGAKHFFLKYGLNLVRNYLSDELKNEIDNFKANDDYVSIIDKAIDEVKYDIDVESLKFMNCINYTYNLRDDKRDEESSYLSKFIAFSQKYGIDKFGDNISTKFKKIVSDKDKNTIENGKVTKLTSMIEDQKLNSTVQQVYQVNNIFSAVYIALYELASNSSRRINVCQNCGRYFVARTKKEIYCDIPNYDGSPTCRRVASKRNYASKFTEDIYLHEYQKIYQRKLTQIYREKDETKKKQMKNEFDDWKDKAKVYVSKYQKKEIPPEVLKKWLNENC